jgi:hypothetical protein
MRMAAMIKTLGGRARDRRVLVLLLLNAALASACSSDPNDPPIEADCTVTGRYLPLRTGASWTYRVTGTAGTRNKTQEVGALEDVGGLKAGVMAFRVTTTKTTGQVISWQQDTGEAIVRHREQDLAGASQTDEYYVPFHTRIDEAPAHLAVGATWTETYDENVTDMVTGLMTTANKVDRWTVEADAEAVRVPAGDFCTLRVKRTTTVGGVAGSTKTYWYARGVGKIKELATGGDTEELASFTP